MSRPSTSFILQCCKDVDARHKAGHDDSWEDVRRMTTSTDDPLVTTDWLAARLDDPKVKIIDASYKMPGVLPLPSDDYLGGHIPGAVFFDVSAIADPNDPRPHMYPDAEQFARDVSALGISSGDTVVAYDSGAWVAAPRAWWMFLSFGHRQVKVLDGGLQKWLREGRATVPVTSPAVATCPTPNCSKPKPAR